MVFDEYDPTGHIPFDLEIFTDLKMNYVSTFLVEICLINSSSRSNTCSSRCSNLSNLRLRKHLYYRLTTEGLREKRAKKVSVMQFFSKGHWKRKSMGLLVGEACLILSAKIAVFPFGLKYRLSKCDLWRPL